MEGGVSEEPSIVEAWRPQLVCLTSSTRASSRAPPPFMAQSRRAAAKSSCAPRARATTRRAAAEGELDANSGEQERKPERPLGGAAGSRQMARPTSSDNNGFTCVRARSRGVPTARPGGGGSRGAPRARPAERAHLASMPPSHPRAARAPRQRRVRADGGVAERADSRGDGRGAPRGCVKGAAVDRRTAVQRRILITSLWPRDADRGLSRDAPAAAHGRVAIRPRHRRAAPRHNGGTRRSRRSAASAPATTDERGEVVRALDRRKEVARARARRRRRRARASSAPARRRAPRAAAERLRRRARSSRARRTRARAISRARPAVATCATARALTRTEPPKTLVEASPVGVHVLVASRSPRAPPAPRASAPRAPSAASRRTVAAAPPCTFACAPRAAAAPSPAARARRKCGTAERAAVAVAAAEEPAVAHRFGRRAPPGDAGPPGDGKPSETALSDLAGDDGARPRRGSSPRAPSRGRRPRRHRPIASAGRVGRPWRTDSAASTARARTTRSRKCLHHFWMRDAAHSRAELQVAPERRVVAAARDAAAAAAVDEVLHPRGDGHRLGRRPEHLLVRQAVALCLEEQRGLGAEQGAELVGAGRAPRSRGTPRRGAPTATRTRQTSGAATGPAASAAAAIRRRQAS